MADQPASIELSAPSSRLDGSNNTTLDSKRGSSPAIDRAAPLLTRRQRITSELKGGPPPLRPGRLQRGPTRRELMQLAKKEGFDVATGRATLRGLLKRMKHNLCGDKRWQLHGAVCVVSAYFLLAALFYSLENRWSYSAALYYASQTGWSVGFGALQERTNASLWFTVFFVLLGATMVGGAVAVLITMVLEKQKTWRGEERVHALLRQGGQRALDIRDLHHHSTREKLKRFSHSGGRCCDCCRGGGWRKCFDQFASEIRTGVAFILWVAGGVAFGLLSEDWSLARSVYFSVTSLSTGGLQAAKIEPNRDTFTNWFVAVWIMSGVPVFAVGVGKFAGILVEAFQREKLNRLIHAELCEEDFYVAARLETHAREGRTPRTTVTFGEYLEFSLVRSGVTDLGTLREIRAQFDELDRDASGEVSLGEMRAALEFDRFDINRDGVVTLAEFLVVCLRLGIGRDPEDRARLFNEVDVNKSGFICRDEFCEWWRATQPRPKGKQGDRKRTLDVKREI